MQSPCLTLLSQSCIKTWQSRELILKTCCDNPNIEGRVFVGLHLFLFLPGLWKVQRTLVLSGCSENISLPPSPACPPLPPPPRLSPHLANHPLFIATLSLTDCMSVSLSVCFLPILREYEKRMGKERNRHLPSCSETQKYY